ncbi:hypothetical protein ACP70R_005529 [Stipagrostis hirtigluma subsp. patula]
MIRWSSSSSPAAATTHTSTTRPAKLSEALARKVTDKIADGVHQLEKLGGTKFLVNMMPSRRGRTTTNLATVTRTMSRKPTT